MQNWDDLRFFLAVARKGSVSAAAIELAVNQSTVSRRINAFEEHLNVRLFERLANGYRLTPEGEALFARAQHMEEEALAIERTLAGRNVELSGPIRLTAPLAMIDALLMPVLKAFREAHPRIELQLDTSDNLYNLTRREADVALRVTREPVPENLIGRQLGWLQFAVYGETLFLKRYRRARKRPPLPWIGEDNTDPRPRWLSSNPGTLECVMRSNDVLATLSAIRHGLGVGRLPTLLGDGLQELTRYTDAPELPAAPLWLLSHADMRKVNRVRVFSAFLSDGIRERLDAAPRATVRAVPSRE